MKSPQHFPNTVKQLLERQFSPQLSSLSTHAKEICLYPKRFTTHKIIIHWQDCNLNLTDEGGNQRQMFSAGTVWKKQSTINIILSYYYFNNAQRLTKVRELSWQVYVYNSLSPPYDTLAWKISTAVVPPSSLLLYLSSSDWKDASNTVKISVAFLHSSPIMGENHLFIFHLPSSSCEVWASRWRTFASRHLLPVHWATAPGRLLNFCQSDKCFCCYRWKPDYYCSPQAWLPSLGSDDAMGWRVTEISLTPCIRVVGKKGLGYSSSNKCLAIVGQ